MKIFKASIKDTEYEILKEKVGSSTWISFDGWSFKRDLPVGKRLRTKSTASAGNNEEIRSPMPGQLIKLSVKAGDKVDVGQTLAVLEAMKMEHSLKSNIKATVETINFNEKDALQMDDLIIKLKED